MIPHATISRDALNYGVAALVLKIDTIPKPDGLGKCYPGENAEQLSNNLAWHPAIFDCRLNSVRAQDQLLFDEKGNSPIGDQPSGTRDDRPNLPWNRSSPGGCAASSTPMACGDDYQPVFWFGGDQLPTCSTSLIADCDALLLIVKPVGDSRMCSTYC
jgi:hypothetical protein